MTHDKEKIWHDVLEIVKVSVSPPVFTTWLSQTFLSELKKGEKRYNAEVGCNSSFVKATIETRYFGLIQDALMKILDFPCDLSFVIKESPKQSFTENSPAPLFEEPNQSEAFVNDLMRARIRQGFTFENFAVSPSNQMAYAAAEAVAKNPGTAYNPLFLYGGVGVGKTHLMSSVGYILLSKGFGGRVVSCTGEEFTNEIIQGIRNKTTQAFRDKYRKLKALFVDDIQFIAGKDSVQEEFFHTFNAVTQNGGQVILTSDRPPQEITKLEERLRSRFEAGLIVDIAPPDFELRCAIVQIKAKEKGIELEMPMVHTIAGNMDSARKMEGFLVRLASEAKLRNMDINDELIKNILGRGQTEENNVKKTINPERVLEAVSMHYSVSKRALTGKARQRLIARPRQVLMYILRIEYGLPLEEVGKVVGGRDHSTVLHAVDTITKMASSSVGIQEDLMGIKGRL